MVPASIRSFLRETYPLQPEQVDFYQRNRFIKLRQVISAEVIGYYNEVITETVTRLNKESRPLEQRNTYGKAFLQLMNLWLEDERVKELVLSPRLGQIAAGLMQCEGVRLYHDQALFKEAGGGITPWHADQYYWPLSTDKTVTAWIPLQATPSAMGPLEFCAGSHVIVEGRELEIGDESERLIEQRLKVTDFPRVAEPFDLGEISFHSGWVFHRAGPNESDQMRKVMTIIYMDRDMRLKAPENKNQQLDWETWCPGAFPGEPIDTPLNPVVYSARG
jgi:ectoine hydroxylase-related dioxygenase (phytanoyl-CoA dioxygenase family)